MATILASPAAAQGCRAQAIMASQCTWLVLEEFGTDRQAASREEQGSARRHRSPILGDEPADEAPWSCSRDSDSGQQYQLIFAFAPKFARHFGRL